MLFFLIVYSAILLALYLVSFGRYKYITDNLDKKAYPLKELFSVGLYLLDSFKYSFNSNYDRKLLSMITELYGHKDAVRMLRIYWANKLLLILLSLLFSLLVGNFTTTDAGYLLFSAVLPAGIAVFTDKDLADKVRKRRQSIQLDFPDFVNKLTLLINAGMTVSKAWEKVSLDNTGNSPLYAELSSAVQDIRSGIPEYRAYEEFAKRCRIPLITRFVSVILQNIRKGNSELVPILRVYANECWELRKNTAKKFGEEASTKLLLPMMLMFAAILLIVGMPAVLALKNI
ncbi:MAG TPA: type II secretion system F family protein [Clostridia bacterium]|nr:type II secretion system F family protein [Clostridia bacterium]